MEFKPIVGGGGSYVDNLIKGLGNLKIQVILVTSGEKNKSRKIKNNLKIVRLKALKDLYFGKGDFMEGTGEITKVILKERPDLIHSHHSLESLMCQAANLNFRLPHVITHHKTPEYRGEAFKLNGKWSVFNLINQQPNIYFIAPSISFVKSLLESGVNPNKISQIYSAVDTTKFQPYKDKNQIKKMRAKIGVQKNELLILIPAMIRERKGIEFAVAGLSQAKIKNKTLKVIITGLGDPKITKQQKVFFKKRLAPHKLLECKFFDDKIMPLIYNAADLTLLTSKAEGLGMALLEAMACGCPVIGTQVMGIDEVIQDKFNGRLVTFDETQELAEAITEVLSNKKLRQEYIKNGLKITKEKFNPRLQALAHQKIYQKLISKKQHQSSRNQGTFQSRAIKKAVTLCPSYEKIIHQPKTIAILTTGSLAHGKFVPGWSDIDILILAKNPAHRYFSQVKKWRDEITEKTNVKTGIETVDYNELLKATSTPRFANDFIKFIKNFYGKGRPSKETILYLKEGTRLPRFKRSVIKGLSIKNQTLRITNYMNNYLVTNTPRSKKAILRKIIKNSLFLMEIPFLVKSGKFDNNPFRIIDKFQKLHRLDLNLLKQSLQKKKSWYQLEDSDIPPEEINRHWNLFWRIVQANINETKN